MKHLFRLSFALLLFAFAASQLHAQLGITKIPAVSIKTLTGDKVNTSTFSNNGKPMIISFWATWCKPCIQELSAIHDEFADWQAATGVKVIAISIDDVRNSSKVQPFVSGKGWKYEVYLDENSDFKRAMGVNNVPHTFVVDGAGNIVHTHSAYVPGDEEKLLEELKALVAKGK